MCLKLYLFCRSKKHQKGGKPIVKSSKQSSRNEEIENPNEHDSGSEEETAPDFSHIHNIPQSADSHFMFKQEQKKWEHNDSPKSKHFTKSFNLDTKLLNLAFLSIPFNERHQKLNIESSAEIIQNAKNYEDQYNNLLAKQINISTNKNQEKPVVPKSNDSNALNATNEKVIIQDWLDDILDI